MKGYSIVLLSLVAMAVGLMTGCTRREERSFPLAQCEAGALLLQERTVERRGFSGTRTSVERNLRFDAADGSSVPVHVSLRWSYRPPEQDQLGVLREPGDGDWHLYVDPAAIDLQGYGRLVQCLQATVADRAGIQRPAVPAIAAIRYASLHTLRRRYECQQDARVEVREDGLIYYRSDSSVLLGTIFGGNAVAVDASALRYLSSREANSLPHPLRYFAGCRDSSGANIFDRFKVTVLSGDRFWAKLQEERNKLQRLHRELAGNCAAVVDDLVYALTYSHLALRKR